MARIQTTPVWFAVMMGEQAEMGWVKVARLNCCLPRGQSARASLGAWGQLSPDGSLSVTCAEFSGQPLQAHADSIAIRDSIKVVTLGHQRPQ